MVKIRDKDGNIIFGIPQKLYDFAMRCKEKLSEEEDSMVLGIIWGGVGSGKSLFAQKLGYTIDRSLNIDNVCFNKDEFINAVLSSKRQVVIGDEGISLFFSRNVMTKEGRLMAEIMDQIRQKNLCVIICIPKLLNIDKSILESANFIGYVWESKKKIKDKEYRIKGNFALFPKISGDDYKQRVVKHLTLKARNPHKFNPHPEPFLSVPGSRVGKECKKPIYPVSEKLYRAKKESILDKYRVSDKQIKGDIIKQLKENNPDLTDGMIAKALGLSRQWVNALKNKGVNAK